MGREGFRTRRSTHLPHSLAQLLPQPQLLRHRLPRALTTPTNAALRVQCFSNASPAGAAPLPGAAAPPPPAACPRPSASGRGAARAEPTGSCSCASASAAPAGSIETHVLLGSAQLGSIGTEHNLPWLRPRPTVPSPAPTFARSNSAASSSIRSASSPSSPSPPPASALRFSVAQRK